MPMNARTRNRIGFVAWLALTATLPVGAVSLATLGQSEPAPQMSVPALAVAEIAAPGSGALVPLVATDAPSRPMTATDAATSAGGVPAGKPLDDLQFVARATESDRAEAAAAQEAIPQLSEPALRQVAESLVTDHKSSNERLSNLAESKGWPVPGPQAATTPPAGAASADFDGQWLADTIAGHERVAALYRAQVRGGEDPDLRKYVRDTLPTIERHLAELRSLQK
jgi:putative membrane protein